MQSISMVIVLAVVMFWATSLPAAQTERRYPVDPDTRWAIGAKQAPVDELKKRLDVGNMSIIDVRSPAQFEKETLPGAINVPMAELEGHLKSVSKETYIVFT